MSTLGQLVAIYIAFAGGLGIFAPLALLDSNHDALKSIEQRLGPEGRAVLCILAGVLWPLLALWGIAWLLRAAGRGVGQCVRLVFPKKPKLPRAEVRR